MSDPLQEDRGADEAGAPVPPRRRGAPPPDLMAYVRRRMMAGKRVGREEPMALFQVSRETLDWARRIVEYEVDLPIEDKVAAIFRLVDEKEVWDAVSADIKGARSKRAKSRVNAVHTELGVRRKAIEDRQRALDSADSPIRLAINAQLRLRDAAMDVSGVSELLDQLITGEREALQAQLDLIDVALLAEDVGMFIDYLAEAKRENIADSLRTVIEAASVALEKAVAAKPPAAREMRVQTWQPRPVRALPGSTNSNQ